MNGESSWRQNARPIISGVIQKLAGNLHDEDGKRTPELRRALVDAYPYGERSMWPYKVWCSEVRIQLGEDPPLGNLPGEHTGPGTRIYQRDVEARGQTRLAFPNVPRGTSEPETPKNWPQGLRVPPKRRNKKSRRQADKG